MVCQNSPYSLQLFACFCMTYNEDTDQLVVGSCQLTCKRARGYYTGITVNTSLELNKVMCERYHREGQLCGSCKEGYSPPVYSYSLSCVKCTASHWGRYIAVSLLPLTLFYITVLTLRLSATSPTMNGLIICLQLLLSPPHQRLIMSSHSEGTRRKVVVAALSILGVWNLDFMRTVYTPFCLQPNTNTLQMLALDYVIAIYPLFLIALSYLLVLLYDHNFRPVYYLCNLLARFRRQWDVRNSLVDAFATFLLLSYVKILSVSVDLLMPVVLYDQSQSRLSQLYLFNQADVAYFSSQHLPYACLALFFLLTFTLLPMLLLFLYPCSCFQVCLNRTGCSCQTLHIFMDTFQGHFKDGTSGTRDLRFFSGLYLLLRVFVYGSTLLNYEITSYAYTAAIISVLAISVALVRPYKKFIYNVIDAGFLTITQLMYVSLFQTSFGHVGRLDRGLTAISASLGASVLLYFALLVAWKILGPISKVFHHLSAIMRADTPSLRPIHQYGSL